MLPLVKWNQYRIGATNPVLIDFIIIRSTCLSRFLQLTIKKCG